MSPCEQHDKYVTDVSALKTDVAVIRRDLEHVVGRLCQHVEDAERSGGWRDRMVNVELAVKELQAERIMMRWLMIGSGVIGGLIGSGSASAVTKFLGLWS